MNHVKFCFDLGTTANMIKEATIDTGATVFKTYYKLGKATLKLSEFLKNNLINVQPSHPLRGQVLYPALAEKADLGFHGRHGLLITPEYGPRVRISAIFVDIADIPENKEPVDYDWIRGFCAHCGKRKKKFRMVKIFKIWGIFS